MFCASIVFTSSAQSPLRFIGKKSIRGCAQRWTQIVTARGLALRHSFASLLLNPAAYGNHFEYVWLRRGRRLSDFRLSWMAVRTIFLGFCVLCCSAPWEFLHFLLDSAAALLHQVKKLLSRVAYYGLDETLVLPNKLAIIIWLFIKVHRFDYWKIQWHSYLYICHFHGAGFWWHLHCPI